MSILARLSCSHRGRGAAPADVPHRPFHGLSTELLLVAFGGAIPEAAKFLLARARRAEAEAVLRRFGAIARSAAAVAPIAPDAARAQAAMRSTAKLVALGVAAALYSRWSSR